MALTNLGSGGRVQGVIEIVVHLRSPHPPEMIELGHRIALGPVDPQVDQGPGLTLGDQQAGCSNLAGAAFGDRRPQRR